MADRATPNLPASDLDATAAFYGRLGFTETFHDDGWLIMRRGDVVLEFFPHPDVDPATSGFSCCIRVADVDELYAACVAAGLPEKTIGWPRVHPVEPQPWGMRMGALIDEDGTLLRLIEDAG